MGNGWAAEENQIRLTDKAMDKVREFILADGETGESLHFIVLEGDCVLTTITRFDDNYAF